MKFKLGPLAIFLALVMQPVQADLVSDSEQIMDLAQQAFPEYFPTAQTTLVFPPYRYRQYDAAHLVNGPILLGVNQDNARVYLLGGPWSGITDAGSASDILSMLQDATKNTSAVADICDLRGVSEDFSYSIDNDTVRVTTNGKCVKPPEHNEFCNRVPDIGDDNKFEKTGIHLYSSVNLTSFALEGINLPAFLAKEFESTVKNSASASSCIKNAPVDNTVNKTEFDVCMDLTDQFQNLGSSLVTIRIVGDSITRVVDDCFNTDASTVTDIVTDEIWLKSGGVFTKLN